MSEAMPSVVSLGHLSTRQLTDATAGSSATYSLTHSPKSLSLVASPAELAT
jgi:hypothetical protein